MTGKTAEDWIEELGLVPHPEGGYFRESYRAGLVLPAGAAVGFAGERAASTAIYFLLKAGQVSHFHRLRADELWHFYTGSPLQIHVLQGGHYRCLELGPEGPFQQVVPAGSWFAAEPVLAEGFVLVGCTVAPGFEFADFEMAVAAQLLPDYPQQAVLIQRLCLS